MAEVAPPRIPVQSAGKQLVSPGPSPAEDAERPSERRTKAGTADPPSTSAGRAFPTKLIRTLSSNHGSASGHAPNEARRNSHNTLDSLSQLINERTRPDNVTAPKLRAAADGDGDVSQNGPPAPPLRSATEPAIMRTDTAGSTREKKKGVSFLSRFMGSKKNAPEEIFDDESESEEKRVEGADADLFSHPLEYIPRFPAPPKYIKVRSRGKKAKDFDHVFLAQELRERTGAEIAQAGGRRLARSAGMTPAEKAKQKNPVWKLEFSKDGKFLAAGGHDSIVRVWAVIATPGDRLAHEREEDEATKDHSRTRLSAPVFGTKPIQEYQGHTASVLDLSWSKNNFLLSSSMDRTVRLWHSSRAECLCCFKHGDIVTSIQFHPRDDRFFLAGSLDSKLRLWSIPDKSVAHWSHSNDIITAVSFTPDGKTAIAGCLSGLCMFYETEGLRYQTQMHVKSAHGKNAKGSKITGIQAINLPPGELNGEVKLLITSNDSRVRVYNMRDKSLELKLKGNENSTSQIQATFSDDARFVICGSEDKKAYIWSTGPPDKDRDKQPLEMFEAHSSAVTSAIMAPARTRQLLQSSRDPLYDLCNSPPVTLVSRNSSPLSRRSTDNERFYSTPPTPVPETPQTGKPEESPAYVARSMHPGGSIIITADYMGRIKVWRKDCAYTKRLRNDGWDANSNFSRKMLNRTSSIATRASRSSIHDPISAHPSSDRIISWRASIEHRSTRPSSINSSFDNIHPAAAHRAPHIASAGTPTHRSPSPHKSVPSPSIGPKGPTARHLIHPLSTYTSPVAAAAATTTAAAASTASASATGSSHHSPSPIPAVANDPPLLPDGPSPWFWNKATSATQATGAAVPPEPGQERVASTAPWEAGASEGRSDEASVQDAVSVLSSEADAAEAEDGDGAEEEVRCRACGGESFRARIRAGQRRLACVRCGLATA